MPPALARLAARLSALDAGSFTENFFPLAAYDQCTINEYQPGIGISRHVDTHDCFGPRIASVTLCGYAGGECCFVHGTLMIMDAL